MLGSMGSTACGVYLGGEAEIGAGGAKRIVERDLTETEVAGLKKLPGRPRQAG